MIQSTQFQTASRVVRLGNAVTWFRNQNSQFMELTSSQSEAIRYILKNHCKEITAADLMEHLQLSQSTVAGIIQRLETKGFLQKAPAPGDGRKNLLVPTSKGLELEERLKSTAVETEHLLLDGMTAAEQAEFNQLLQKALDNINAVRTKGMA